MTPLPQPPAPPEGSVLVRVRVADRGWSRELPKVPDGRVLTLTVGHPGLLPVPVDDLVEGGYRVVGVAAEHGPVRASVDILVPADLRRRHPSWFATLVAHADRVFDLRHGPVQRVLAAQLALHLRSAVS